MTTRYTQNQTDALIAAYKAATTDAARKDVVVAQAKALGKSTQSVISKLSREGVYVKATPVAKDGKPRVNKEQYIQHIRIMLGARDHELDSLEKVSKRDLEIMSRCLNRLNDRGAV